MPHQILIIDDQHDILRILEREFLKNKLATVLTASNIAQAVSIVEQRGIDLLITDVRIGTENGFDLVKQVRERSPGTGLMMMTAYRSPGLRQMADQLGVAFFIEKPFAVSNLLHAVEHFFATRPATMRPTVQAAANNGVSSMNALGHFSAQELVQLFCLNGRGVLISMSSFNHPMAKIYIQKGRVLHCEYGEQVGEKAFYAALRIPNPQLGIEDYALPVPQTIDNSWEWLLLEAARMADEAAIQAPPPPPDPNAIFVAASQTPPPSPFGAPAPAAPAPAMAVNPANLFSGPPPPVTPAPATPPPPADPFADFWKQAKLAPGARLNVS